MGDVLGIVQGQCTVVVSGLNLSHLGGWCSLLAGMCMTV